MAHRKKNKRQENNYQENDYYDVLKEKVPITLHELIKMIHRINPTGETISSKKASERYKIKNSLQSLLIRRFHEKLMVEQPDPENPGLVGFRLRHFGEDACHAMIDELDEDARAWTQRQIDEAMAVSPYESSEVLKKPVADKSKNTVDYVLSDRIENGEDNVTKEELIKLGQNALAEYDYDACENYFQRALKVAGDDSAPALFLLELYVDYVADYNKTVDLSNTIPASVKTNEKVRVFLALAAARSGHIDSALEWIKLVSHPRVSEVYLLSVKHLIQEGDLERASNLLKKLESFEQIEIKPEIEKLVKNIQSLRAKSLEPVEQEMILAWEQGRTEDSLKLADQILSISAGNKAARHIRHEFEKQQIDKKINEFLRLADEAQKNNDFSLEAELLNKALASGANAQNLAKRLEYAQNEAKRKKEEMEVLSIINLLAEGDKKKAFLQYIDLNTQQRSHLKDKIHDSHFGWLDQILSARIATKPEKLVEAVLVLGKSKENLNEKKEPERIIADMEPHDKVLQAVPEAHEILHQAETLLRAVKYKEARDLLDNAARFLDMEGLEKARTCMDQIQVNSWQEDDKKLFDEINHRLHYREKFVRLKQKYNDSSKRGDHFTARAMARELAKHTGQDTSGYWLDRVEEHTSCIKKEWALLSIDIDELPVHYASFGLTWSSRDTNCCLMPEKRHLIIATSYERWVFLRIFSLDEQKFHKAIVLRTPKQMILQNIYPVGNTLWMTGEKGDALEICLEPLDILSWYDFSSFIREEDVVEGAWLFPKSKSLWLDKRKIKINLSEVIEIIDIDQQRVIRQIKSSGLSMVINTCGQFCVAIQNISTKTVQVYSGRGKPIDTFAFQNYQTIDAAAFHPNRNDFIFLSFDDSELNQFGEFAEEEQGDLVITIVVRPDVKGKYQPLRLENTNGELEHSISTSLDKGIIFISYIPESSDRSEYIFAAFKENGQGFDQLYEVRIPSKIAFACDEFSGQVAAMNFQGNRVQAVVLDENPPVFDYEAFNSFQKVIPEFQSHYYMCNIPPDTITSTSMYYMGQIKRYTEKELNDIINQMKQPGSHTPDEIFAFAYALQRYSFNYYEKADDLKMWMRTQYHNYFNVLIDLAEEAIKKKNWEEVISLLERISRPDLKADHNDVTARHICHLLGISYFIKGEIERALEIWMEGVTYENGKCDLNPYIEYARFSLLPAEERKAQKSDIAKILNLFESIDDHLAHMKWPEAIETIEKNFYMVKNDLQMLARLTWAYLNINVSPVDRHWLFKIINLGNYCEVYGEEFRHRSIFLPPFISTWPDSRLSDIARQARQWLDGL